MGKLFYVMGKSASGKDTVYRHLLEDRHLDLKPLVLYTTRPMREGEQSGVQYYFTDEAGLAEMKKAGRVIEERSYSTVHGIWKYFTADTENIDLDHFNYIGIGVLSSFAALKDYYGEDRVIPVYVEVEDGERLERALKRERSQEKPCYAELCRRFLADSEDFSDENLARAGITLRFVNRNLDECLGQISRFIEEKLFFT